MGNDGRNYLTLRGSPDALDEIVERRAAVARKEDEPGYYETLRRNYFAEGKYNRIRSNYLIISYDFRNEVCEDYLLDLLSQYPMLWMKNEYNSEEGWAGVWIARMRDGEVDVQAHEWKELCWEEEHYIGTQA